MWVIDIRHWLGENLLDAGLPQLKFKVKKLGEIITYATAIEDGIFVDVRPRCWRKPQRKPCAGELEIILNPETKQIHWLCTACGDEGVVSGWEGLIWDMSDCSSDLSH
jgi:hypothetical protein